MAGTNRAGSPDEGSHKGQDLTPQPFQRLTALELRTARNLTESISPSEQQILQEALNLWQDITFINARLNALESVELIHNVQELDRSPSSMLDLLDARLSYLEKMKGLSYNDMFIDSNNNECLI